MKKKKKYVLIISGILLIGIIVFISVFFTSTGFRERFISTIFRSHKSLLKSNPDFVFEANELYYYYQANEIESDSLFIDKIIQVTGHLAEVIEEEDGKYTIILRDDMAFSGINCSMDVDFKDNIKELKTGDTVTVKGICAGMLLDVILTRCVITGDSAPN